MRHWAWCRTVIGMLFTAVDLEWVNLNMCMKEMFVNDSARYRENSGLRLCGLAPL